MIRSINTVNKSMNILQKKQEQTSTNIANVKTPGYKFQDMVQTTLESNDMVNYSGKSNTRQELGAFYFGNGVDTLTRNFNQGTLMETREFNDFSIVGDGFFTIEISDGKLGFTRNGNFKLNGQNQLVTMEGYLVLGRDRAPVDVVDEKVSKEDLLLSDFEDNQMLESMGDTIFISGVEPTIGLNGEIRQGYLEMSNVDIADELVKMIQISREFEANQKVLHSSDETLNKAVNEIGRV